MFCCSCLSSVSNAEEMSEIFQHVILAENETSYTLVASYSSFLEIKAKGQNSASGLYSKDINRFVPDFPLFTWSWQAERLQSTADIAIKGRDDYAASIQLVFGELGLFSKPEILNYAWVGNHATIGSTIKSPRAPNHIQTIILNNNQSPLFVFLNHERNILEDFEKAFGHPPKKSLTAIGLLTDNDQTGEEVLAHYRLILQ